MVIVSNIQAMGYYTYVKPMAPLAEKQKNFLETVDVESIERSKFKDFDFRHGFRDESLTLSREKLNEAKEFGEDQKNIQDEILEKIERSSEGENHTRHPRGGAFCQKPALGS